MAGADDQRRFLVGIDLGTTFSLVSVLEAGRPIILPNGLGEILTPSAVSVMADGTVLVGAAAKARAASHPEATALAFKRDMGTTRLYELAGRKMSPPELSALVLGALKRDAEVALGGVVDEAVVTVPAYFGDAQRQATRDAGAIAGLKVERIINEPTAAAMAYGLHQRDRELRAAVLDLGGGTFDVTLLEIMEGVIEIRATAGDARLGGEDFDALLAAEIARRLAADGHDLHRDPRALARLRVACEAAKRRLSDEETTRIALPALPLGGRATVDVETALGRREAETLWAPLLDRMRGPILQALRDAAWLPSRIDEVLLVGGSTRMPCVAALAAQLFGRLPLRTLPPDEAVALGAAVQAGLKSGDVAVADVIVTDVAPFTLGTATAERFGNQLVNDLFCPIIERGTVIPTSRSKRFSTLSDFQEQILFAVYQGEHSLCKDNTKLGEYRLAGLRRVRAGEESVDVRFTYDLNGILEVDLTLVASGRTETLVIEGAPGRLTPEQVQQARTAMARLKFHPRDALPNTTVLLRADALFVELTGAERDALGQAIAAFRLVLETQEARAIEAARSRLSGAIGSLRR